MAVGKLGAAAGCRVARDRAVVGHERPPEKRHQAQAALDGRGSPVLPIQRRLFDPFIVVGHGLENFKIEPTEQLLDPHPVDRNQDDVFRLARPGSQRDLRHKKDQRQYP